MTSKIIRKTLETIFVGTLLFGNPMNSYAPARDGVEYKQTIDRIADYYRRKEILDSKLAEYSKYVGKPLIDKWVGDAIKRIHPHEIVDVPYVLATIKQESRFKPYVKSEVGARGLMQVMPDTWNGIEKDYSFSKYGFDPDKNLEVGIKVLSNMARFCERNYSGWDELSKEDKISLVSAAYNGGNGHLMKKDWNINKMWKQTQDYVPKILKYYDEFSLEK